MVHYWVNMQIQFRRAVCKRKKKNQQEEKQAYLQEKLEEERYEEKWKWSLSKKKQMQ